jgi:hypothetical protein
VDRFVVEQQDGNLDFLLHRYWSRFSAAQNGERKQWEDQD